MIVSNLLSCPAQNEEAQAWRTADVQQLKSLRMCGERPAESVGCPVKKDVDETDDRMTQFKKKAKELRILDAKTAQNLSIFLGSFRLPYEEIRDIVLEVDEERLSEALIQARLMILQKALHALTVSVVFVHLKRGYEQVLLLYLDIFHNVSKKCQVSDQERQLDECE
ncbi:hypothetical protein IRJ41_017703 [Triplophysa rosa]|uniref:FH2 domain-containing protein n=1 Tax=Triplophysa rosa TaxID=992332 RepID=A0A9W7WK22_TRIRA|nr:hypothetical protein IRJ41_017703 [Triplophysa rosa]